MQLFLQMHETWPKRAAKSYIDTLIFELYKSHYKMPERHAPDH